MRSSSTRTGIAAALAAFAVALAVPAAAPGACEVAVPDQPDPDPTSCSPPGQPPPSSGSGSSGGSGTSGPPRIILWTSGYDINPLNGNSSGIWISRINGSERRRIVKFERVNRDFEEHGFNLPDDHPSFSPDFRRIAFTSNRANSTNWDIYVMNANGTGITRRTTHAGLDTEPVFSPDGTRLAFASEIFGQLDIVVMNLATGVIQRVTTNSREDIEPAWRPDGQEIAFSRVLGNGEKDVFAIKPDGTGERRLTNVPGEDHDPTYSPNGQQLVITSERPPFSPPFGNVYKIRASDGASLGDLTGDQDFGAGDPFWSRDGSLIAYFKSGLPILQGPQILFVMNASGGQKVNVPGEALANIHPALGLAVDDDGDGTANYLESSGVGKAGFAPKELRAQRTKLARFTWKHPRRWRRLDTMWLRISYGRWLAGMVRYSVRDEAFSLFDGVSERYTKVREVGEGKLRTSLFSLNLERSRVVGVSKKKLKLLLALRLRPKIEGTGFRIAGRELRIRAQANSRGKGRSRSRNQEEELGRLRVLRP
jgi:Tol biopolymer transport system component